MRIRAKATCVLATVAVGAAAVAGVALWLASPDRPVERFAVPLEASRDAAGAADPHQSPLVPHVGFDVQDVPDGESEVPPDGTGRLAEVTTPTERAAAKAAAALEARVVSRLGGSFGGERLSVTIRILESAAAGLATTTLRCDRDGRFRIDLTAEQAASPSLALEIMRISPDGGLDGSGAMIPVPGSVEGARDLGTIELEPLPILAEGLVEDEAGKPIVGPLTFGVRSWLEKRGAWAPMDLESCAVERGPGGAFTLRAFPVDGMCEIGVVAHGCAPPHPLPRVPFGARGLRIVLPKAGRLEGSMIVRPATRQELRLALGRDPPEPYAQGVYGALGDLTGLRQAENGSFRADHLPPGWYVFRIETGLGRTVFRADGIEIVAGEVCRDPRLQRIDVESLARPIVITVEDPQGRPVADLSVLEVSGAQRCGKPTDSRGQARFLGSLDPLAVEVHAPGFRPERVEGIFSDHLIALRRPIAVTLVAHAPAIPDGVALIPVLEPVYGDAFHRVVGDRSLARDGTVVVGATASGRFRVRWLARAGAPSLQLRQHDPSVIEVKDARGEQRFDVRLPEDLPEQIAALRAR